MLMTLGAFLSIVLNVVIVLILAGVVIGAVGYFMGRLRWPIKTSEHMPFFLGLLGVFVLVMHFFGARWDVIAHPRLAPYAMPAMIIGIGVFVVRLSYCIARRDCWKQRD